MRGQQFDLMEGDMIAPSLLIAAEAQAKGQPLLQKGKRTGLWPEGIIPYVIDGSITGYRKDMTLKAIGHWQDQTCIRFIKKQTQHKNYIEFFKGAGCFADLGMIGGKQVVSVGPGCAKLGVIAHEIGHAIGFYHEHSRPDRDDHIIIKTQNIKPGYAFNFQKYSRDTIDTHGAPYDYGSLMHYRPDSFSTERGQPTIVPKKEGVTIGQRTKLSDIDISLAKSMYNCDAQKGPPIPPPMGLKAECKDKYPACIQWGAQGHCADARYKAFLSTTCKVSCNVCIPEVLPMIRSRLGSPTLQYVISENPVNLTILVKEVTTDSCTIRVKALGTGFTRVHVMYKKVGSEEWGYGLYRKYMSSKAVYTINNLESGTWYRVVVRVSKRAGGKELWSDFTQKKGFKTKAGL